MSLTIKRVLMTQRGLVRMVPVAPAVMAAIMWLSTASSSRCAVRVMNVSTLGHHNIA